MSSHLSLGVLLLSVLTTRTVYSHALDFWGVRSLQWSTDQIANVTPYGDAGRKVSIAGRECVTGGKLNFNVRDQYAFDIDENVTLDLEFHLEPVGSKVIVIYDRNDVAPVTMMGAEPQARHEIELPNRANSQWHRHSIVLERARFANLGYAGSDIAIEGKFTVCNLHLRRSNTHQAPTLFGRTTIEVLDEKGRQTPARMGIYDRSGRLPLPSDDALPVRDLNAVRRVVPLRLQASAWPIKNRSVFYVDGRYQARLPAGKYELIVTKGPEYRFARLGFTVEADQTKPIKVKLQRWTEMAARGWYSGEDHVHYARHDQNDERTLQLFTQAEDLRVANILQMGNITRTYFPHREWRTVRAEHDPSFVLVPGQEDPRTSQRGHTLQLNLKKPVRNPSHYMLYHEVFEDVRAQGGLVGYAHVNEAQESLNTARGMAIDMPFGLVDFAEIFSLHFVGVSSWFDFLNLGYKLAPAAGTDYPWGDVPGAVRNYVKIDKPFTPEAWFEGLKKGHTFVTSGPMLEFSVNGQSMGSEIRVKRGEPLTITAESKINPDMGRLVSLELIEQGESVKKESARTGAPAMELRHELAARHGTWFVLRARGSNASMIALSAPIYVFVDGQNFWKTTEIAELAAKQKRKMQELLGPYQPELIEAWEAREPGAKYWGAQQSALKDRIDRANALYDDVVKRATGSASQQPSP